MQSSESFYRSIAGEGATYIGLLVVVYDTLAADLRRAGRAVHAGDIAGRCAATNHAFLLLGHLDSWAESMEDGQLAASLRDLYRHIRLQSTLLQANPQAQAFFDLADLVNGTRAAWQQREAQQMLSGTGSRSPAVGYGADLAANPRQSWSA